MLMTLNTIHYSLSHFDTLGVDEKGETLVNVLRSGPLFLHHCARDYPEIFSIIMEKAVTNGSEFFTLPIIAMGEEYTLKLIETLVQRNGYVPTELWKPIAETYPTSRPLKALCANFLIQIATQSKLNRCIIKYVSDHLEDMDYDTLSVYRDNITVLSEIDRVNALHEVLRVSHTQGFDMRIVLQDYIPFEMIAPEYRSYVSLSPRIRSKIMDKEWIPDPHYSDSQWEDYVLAMLNDGRNIVPSYDMWLSYIYWDQMPLHVQLTLLFSYETGNLSEMYFELGHRMIERINHPSVNEINEFIMTPQHAHTFIHNIMARLINHVYHDKIELFDLTIPYYNSLSEKLILDNGLIESCLSFWKSLIDTNQPSEEIDLHL